MDELIKQVVTAAVTAIAGIVSGYVILLLHKLQQRVGLQVSAETDAKVRAQVQNAILSTDERLRAEAKRLTEPIAGKIDAAMRETTTKILNVVPGINAAEAETLANEELPKVRAAVAPAAADFLKKVGTAAASSLPLSPPLPSP